MRALGGVCVVALLLSACNGVGKSPEERINAAIPPSDEVVAAKTKLDALAKAQSADLKAVDDEYQSRLKVRALECARGYEPTMWSDDDSVREALSDKECFTSADAKLRGWLGMRRMALLLAAPPLRPVPAKAPARITTAGNIQEVNFADQAGIALVQLSKQYQVIDIGSNEVVHQGAASLAIAPSPNGRLFLVNDGDNVEVHEAETGETLTTFPGVRITEFHWIGNAGAIYQPPVSADRSRLGPVFLDLVSGKETRIPMNAHGVDRVLPLAGNPSRYAVLSWTRIGVLQLQPGAHGSQMQLLSEHVSSVGGGWDRSSASTADGRTFFGTAESLKLLSLESLQTRTVTLLPLRLVAAVATPNPDQVLMRGFFKNAPGTGSALYMYSFSQRTLATVQQDQLLSTRILYIPSLRKNAVIDGARIVLVDSVPTSDPVEANQFLELRSQALAAEASTRVDANQMARARMLAKLQIDGAFTPELRARMQQEQGISDAMLVQARRDMTTMTAMPTAIQGPVATLAKNADIRAIGVYQGSGIGKARGAGNRTGTVQVHVRRSARPIILSLSAYEPVRWVLTVEPGAKLAAVLTSGYYSAEIIGAGSAPVQQLGQHYAYKRGGPEYLSLDTEVARWTGKRIGAFQGRYTGEMFVVGM